MSDYSLKLILLQNCGYSIAANELIQSHKIPSQTQWITNSKHKKSYEYEKSKFKEGQFSYWYSSIENKEFIQNLFFLLNLIQVKIN
mgnify:CR=1 FL=1